MNTEQTLVSIRQRRRAVRYSVATGRVPHAVRKATNIYLDGLDKAVSLADAGRTEAAITLYRKVVRDYYAQPGT